MIENNIKEIREKLDSISRDVEIVAATKTRTIDEIRRCMGTGMVLALLSRGRETAMDGENRVQELTEKYTPDFRWDFIGRLQTNKVKYIIDKVELIHSLDRIPLAETIQKECEKHSKKQKVLIEINTGDEENKGGISLCELDGFLNEVARFDKIIVTGMMAVAPLYYGEDELKRTFTGVYEEFFKRKTSTFNTLSMGMSNDYLIAAECGATMVRPGRAIFGERSYITQ